MLYVSKYDSPVGLITIAADDANIKGLWFDGQKYFGSSFGAELGNFTDNEVICNTHQWLDLYFRGSRPSILALPLAPEGSEFRQAVWKLLCEIPYGEVVSYGELSKMLGKEKMSAQAVGGAVGHNPISIIIPCHRVVGANGSLTGYAGGINIKQKLLEHEGLDMSRFYVPKKGTAL